MHWLLRKPSVIIILELAPEEVNMTLGTNSTMSY